MKKGTVNLRAMLDAVQAAPMTRAAIARETGLSRTVITRIANGERGRAPSYETVYRIAALHSRVLPTGNK
jgi:transcriptional regulator with XRE-family HTH domain